MDPNYCYESWLDAVEREDWEAAVDAWNDLYDWLAKGGFEPSWSESEEDDFRAWVSP